MSLLSEKQEDHLKGRKSGEAVRPDVQMGRDGGASVQTGHLGAHRGRDRERLGNHETQEKKLSKSPECQGDTELRWEDGEVPPSCISVSMWTSSNTEFCFSAKAEPRAVSAKLRSYSLGVTPKE